MSLSESSGTLKEWFLWLQCWEGRPSSPAPTSRSWQNSESISDEFSLTRFQWESFFRQWRLHTSLKTWEAITEFGWTVSPHPPHNPIKHPQISACVESWRIHSVVWSLRLWLWLMQWEFGYVSKTGHGTDKRCTCLFFFGVRPWKWMDSLWKNRVFIKNHQS